MARTTHILRSRTPLRDLAAMTDPTTPPSLLDELKRRKVVRVGLVYGAVAFAILEGVDVLVEALTLPDVVRTVIAVAALGGFPLALALVWAFEATPEGVQRDRGDAGGGAGSWLTARSLVAAVLFTSLGLGAGWLAGRGGAGETTDSSPATEGASIAVLPFLDLSPGGDQAYFADGLAEELLNVLVRSQDLKVAARTSSFAFRENRDIREIGNTLGVSTVVEGSVRRAGDRLRVTAQLIQVSDGFHLWSQTFDGSASDVFAVQDSIAAAITGALQVTLGVALDLPRQARGLTDDVDAHDLYLLGLHRWRTRNPEQLQEAIGFFEQALGVDSTFALAYTGVAWVWSVASVYDFSLSPREAISQAKDALARAQALSPDLPEAVAIGGFITSQYDWEWDEGEQLLRRAIDLAPSSPWPHLWLSVMKWRRGFLDEALRAIDAALALDPLTALSHEILALTLGDMGRIEEAATAFRQALKLEPSFLNAYYELAILYLDDGRGEQAGQVFAEWGAAVGYPEAEGLTIIGEALADPAVLPEAISRAEAFFDYSGRGQTNLAPLFAHLGETERAIELFRELLLQRASLASTGGTFQFRPLWNHSEFRAMHAETNLPLAN